MKKTQDAFGQDDLDELWTYNTRSVNTIAHRVNLKSCDSVTAGDAIRHSNLYNPYEGVRSAWQLTETVDEFLERVPPLFHRLENVPWIWIANPHTPKKSKVVEEEDQTFVDFVSGGRFLLDGYMEHKEQLLATGVSATTAEKRLTGEREIMRSSIFELATRCQVTSGKVCILLIQFH